MILNMLVISIQTKNIILKEFQLIIMVFHAVFETNKKEM
jgi:hypothetical protein